EVSGPGGELADRRRSVCGAARSVLDRIEAEHRGHAARAHAVESASEREDLLSNVFEKRPRRVLAMVASRHDGDTEEYDTAAFPAGRPGWPGRRRGHRRDRRVALGGIQAMLAKPITQRISREAETLRGVRHVAARRGQRFSEIVALDGGHRVVHGRPWLSFALVLSLGRDIGGR